jgi:hypothetical protein
MVTHTHTHGTSATARRTPRVKRRRTVHAQADLASLEQRVTGDERTAAADRLHARSVAARATAAQRSVQRVNWQLQSVPSEAQLAGMRNQLAAYSAYAACIPALQSEIDGLRLNWRIDADKPATDSFKLFTSAPAPASCSGATSSH